MAAPPLVRAGSTCWRIAQARRVALLLDNEAYFGAVRSALRQARRSVFLLGWEFDPRTRLAPRKERIGELLRELADERPRLDIRVLMWEMALPISAGRGLYRQRAYRSFEGSRVQFRFDDRHPPGACHHQKLLVVDDALAFCSGGDFSPNRWDSAAHLDRDRRRRLPSGKAYAARHEVTMAVDGDAAAALGELARTRWARAGGEAPGAPASVRGKRWPAGVAPQLRRCPVAIARTQPAYDGEPAVRENEALYLAAIAAAERLIYLENQYFTSPRIGEALAARLAERNGPEVVVVVARRSPSYFDRLTMDGPREGLIGHLRAVDRHGRFHASAPVTADGSDIVVHSKLMIVDDRLLRVGSANLNNRSMGLDTECDLAIDAALCGEAGERRVRHAIAAFRERLLGHFRLRGLPGRAPAGPRSVVARYHLGDPQGGADTFRPWRRRTGL